MLCLLDLYYLRFTDKGLSLSNHTVFTSKWNALGDSIVYRTSDEFGDILVVDRLPYRSLTFNSIFDQSSMDLRKPNSLIHEYTYAMMLVLAFIKPVHATILGLGGGCLLRSLHEIFPKCKLHAVELRQRVYEVALEYFGIPEGENITITTADAEQWLKTAEDASTNIIFSDMFAAYSMNPFQMQNQFVNQCHRVLNKKGWLVINYHEILDLNSSFFELLGNLFPSVFIYNTLTSHNKVVFASKDNIDSLHRFDLAILALEKKLGSKSINFFNRLTKLNSKEHNRHFVH